MIKNVINGSVSFTQTSDTDDGYITLRLPPEGFPLLSRVCLPEADARRAGRGMSGWFARSDEELDHAPDESEG